MAASVMFIIGAGAWIAQDRSEIAIRDQVGEGISTILDVSHEAVGTWIQGHRVAVELWADSEEVLAFTQRLVRSGPIRVLCSRTRPRPTPENSLPPYLLRGVITDVS